MPHRAVRVGGSDAFIDCEEFLRFFGIAFRAAHLQSTHLPAPNVGLVIARSRRVARMRARWQAPRRSNPEAIICLFGLLRFARSADISEFGLSRQHPAAPAQADILQLGERADRD